MAVTGEPSPCTYLNPLFFFPILFSPTVLLRRGSGLHGGAELPIGVKPSQAKKLTSAEYAPFAIPNASFAIPKTQHEGREPVLKLAVPSTVPGQSGGLGFALQIVHFKQAEILALNPPRCWLWLLSH